MAKRADGGRFKEGPREKPGFVLEPGFSFADSLTLHLDPSMKQAAPSLDLVEELQLRRWARENYVPSRQRDAGWHPVIHNEMRLKEQELLAERIDPIGGRYVPLPLEAPGTHLRHQVKPPRFLAAPRHAEEFHYT